MASRPSWEGVLAFNLISIPVKAYNAASKGGGHVGFHLLHKDCNERIRYKKVCPVHGEVSNEDIVSGYEHAKGQYVIVDANEKKGLKDEDDKAIQVDSFVPPGVIDPIYFSGRTYYLVPAGVAAQRPYSVLLAAMRKDDRQAIGRVVMSGRAHVTIVRPLGKVLCMTMLAFDDEVKSPAEFEKEVGNREATAKEAELAEALVESATDPEFELARYKDDYAERVVKLIEKKVKKKPGSAKRRSSEQVGDLMAALKESLTLENRRAGRRERTATKPRRAARPKSRARA
jgi:DNA end-binding protein Ku